MKKSIIYLLFCLIVLKGQGQNIGISSNGSTPNDAAMLDVDVSGLSTKKGLLIPRVTVAQKTAMNPLPEVAQGLMIYQTDGFEGFYYNTSTTTVPSWKFILPSTGSNGGWGLSGNSGTTPGTNFIGTTDAKDFVLKSNGAERMRFLANGNTGFGTSVPGYKFDFFYSSLVAGDRALNINFNSSTTTDSDSTSGLFVRSTSSSSGNIVGALLSTKANGNGNSAGVFSVVTGANSGSKIGYSTNVSGSGKGLGYGAVVSNSGSENYGGYFQVNSGGVNYGTYLEVTGGGMNYGLYADVEGDVGLFVTGNPYYSAIFEKGIVTVEDSVSIGYDGWYIPQYMLDVNGRSNFTKALHFNGLAGNAGDILQSNGANTAPTWIDPSFLPSGIWEDDGWNVYNLNGGNIGINCIDPLEQLTVDGNISATGFITANDGFACASDRRYKKDVTSLKGSLQNVLLLNGVSYNWKITEFPEKSFTDEEQVGFIAQDIEVIYPHMVFTDSKGFKSVDYSRLTPVLVEAVKELNNKVVMLEGELEKERAKTPQIDTLIERIERLEALLKNSLTSSK